MTRWNGVLFRSRDGLCTFLIASFLGCGILLAFVLAETVPGVIAAARRASEQVPYERLARAQEAARIGKKDDARRLFRGALDAAVTSVARRDAALAYAEFLYRESATDTDRIVARQYARSVAGSDTRPAARLRALRLLADIEGAFTNVAQVLAITREALPWVAEPDGRADWLLTAFQTVLDHGAYADAAPLLAELTTLPLDTRRASAVELAKARLAHRSATDDVWAQARAAAHLERTHVLRSSWADEADAAYQRVLATGDVTLRGEAAFRRAELLLQIGRPDQALAQLERMAREELRWREDKMWDLTIRLAEIQGQAARAAELLSAFVRRFPWNDVPRARFLSLLRQMADRGYREAALDYADRYLRMPAAREVRPALLLWAAETAETNGEPQRAEAYYRELWQLRPEETYARAAACALARRAQARGCPDEASAIFSDFLARFPHAEKKGEMLLLLYENERRRPLSWLTRVNIALAAAQDIPEDPRVCDVLLDLARWLEDIGLYAMALQYYQKVPLLGYTAEGGEKPQSDPQVLHVIHRALLGSARCYLRMGERLKADHLFRELCSEREAGLVRSEAACHWTFMAIHAGQQAEARRRLALVHESDLAPELRARLRAETALLDLATAPQPDDAALQRFFEALSSLHAEEQRQWVVRAYRTCLDRLEALRAVENAKTFLEQAAHSPYASLLPMTEFYCRVARLILEESGLDALAAYMRQVSPAFKRLGVLKPNDVETLDNMVADMEEKSRRIAAFSL